MIAASLLLCHYKLKKANKNADRSDFLPVTSQAADSQKKSLKCKGNQKSLFWDRKSVQCQIFLNSSVIIKHWCQEKYFLILPFTKIHSNLDLNMAQEHVICRKLDEPKLPFFNHHLQQTEAIYQLYKNRTNSALC